jgi:hypothetical protein
MQQRGPQGSPPGSPPWAGYGPPPAQQSPAGGYGPPPQGYPPPYVDPSWAQPEPPTARDVEQLRNLAIGHFVYAGLVGVAALFSLVYVLIGFVAAAAPASPGGPDPLLLGGIFVVIGLAVATLLGTKAVLLILSGLGLRSQTRQMVSYVAAGLSCMTFPLGTVLGVLTFVVLSRPAIKALYRQRAAQQLGG